MDEEFKCLPGCGMCCGCVPIPPEVIRKHIKKRQRPVLEVLDVSDVDEGVICVTPDWRCLFLSTDKKCLIYEDRPKICRIWGTIAEYPCAYIAPDGYKRCRRETDMIKRRFRKMPSAEELRESARREHYKKHGSLKNQK